MQLFRRLLQFPGRLRLWQQFVLLGLFVVTVPIILTSIRFLHDGRSILQEHEIIDLSDESNLRVNDIRQDFESIAMDISRESRLVADQLNDLEVGGNSAPLSTHPEFANEALSRFSENWSQSLPVPGEGPKSIRQHRRRFCRGILLCGVAYTIAANGSAGRIVAKHHPADSEEAFQFMPESAETNALHDLSKQLLRDVPGYMSNVFVDHSTDKPRAVMAVGRAARWVAGKPVDVLAVLIDFTRYFENRSRVSPRHRYMVARPDGSLIVNPETVTSDTEVKIQSVMPWSFPDHSWVSQAETPSEREERIARVLREGGIRLAGRPIPEMTYYYRKGHFQDDFQTHFGTEASAILREVILQLNAENAKNPRFRFSEPNAASTYIEMSHPDQAELVRISTVVEQWWKTHRPEENEIDWNAPLKCETFQGQFTYLRIDTSNDAEPLRLIVAASLEELHEDINTRFRRIFLQWVLPAVSIAILLTVVLVVMLTRSLQQLATTTETLTDPKTLENIGGTGCLEVTQLAASLRHMATRLRDEAARYHSILRAAGEGIVVTSNEGLIEEANRAAARMFGFGKPEDLFGRAVSDLMADPLPDVPAPGTSGQLTVTAGKSTRSTPFGDAIRGRRKDGTSFWLEVTLRPVALKGRSVVTFVFRDVSQRRAAEEQIRLMNEDLENRVKVRTTELAEANTKLEIALQQAEAASRAKDTFVANMSHELRQPLHIIIGFTEAMREEAADLGHEFLAPDLNKILSAAKHLLDLINDILDLAKISAGRMELSTSRFEVKKLLDDVRTLVEPLGAKNSNQFLIDAPAELGKMTSDERRVRQILLNLLSNAFKFTSRGTITLRVRRLSEHGTQWVEFAVNDTGKGMNADQVARLFQRFYQADPSTTREQGGTGLGLAITQSFTELLGGRPIRVTSSPGNGSEFVIRLPAEVILPASREITRPASAAAPPPEESSELIVLSSDARTVLLIDDDEMVQELMRRFLRREGFRVMAATTGAEGLRLAQTLHPAVILLDVMMPGEDGWSILTQLKANQSTCDIPVVMVTIVDDHGRGFTLGAADYLTKPIDWQRLSAILKLYRSGNRAAPVLVIDDDPESREMIRRFLDKDGWNVIEAADGEAGLRAVASDPPALILLDLMMPGMDGFSFLDELNHRIPGCRTPVIVLTAKELTNAEQSRLKGRVAEILQKGDYIQIDHVLELIRSHASAKK